jgi:RHS repeat-associated protein
VSIGPASGQEGTTLAFPLTVSGTGGGTVTVTWTATAATDAADYAGGSGSLIFYGDGTQNVQIATTDDNGFAGEPNATFTVTAKLGSSSSSTTGTITEDSDDPPKPTLSINDVTGPENSGSFVFKVTLSSASPQATTVQYSTEDVSAKAGEDYGGVSGTLTIPAGSLSGTISVPIIDDKSKDDVPTEVSTLFGEFEPQTEFWVLLSNPQGASFGGTNVGIGTIYDPSDPTAPVQQCTCSCGCGNVDIEPTQDDGGQNVHLSFPTATSTLAMVQSPLSENLQTMMLGLTFLGLHLPHPIIEQPDVLSPDVASATAITAQLTLGGIQGSPVYYSPSGYTAGQTVVFAAQVDASSLPTGVYNYTMTITEQYADGSTVVRSYTGQQNIENLDNSTAGAGWTLRGLPRLWPQAAGTNQAAGVSLSDGAGNLYFFTQNPDGSFTRPAGEPNFSTLVQNADGSYTLTDRNQNVSHFTAQGYLTSVTDSDGNVTTVTTDSSGNPLSILDPEGRLTSFTYSGGLLTGVSDFAGRTVTIDHNAAGQITEIDLPNPGNGEAQGITTFAYDTSTGEMTSLTDASGTTQFAYNAFRELTQTTNPDGSVSKLNAPLGQALVNTAGGVGTASNPAALVYASSLVGSQTDENGHTTTFVPGPFGEDASTTDALSNTVQTAYNSEGEAVQITAPPLTPGGQPLVTTNVYNTMGDLVETDYPDGTKETWQFDPKFNEPVVYVDRAGRETDYTLDPNNGDVLDVIQVGQNGDANLTTQYVYTPLPTQSGQPPAGLVAKEIDPRGIETDYTYSAHGLVTMITYAVGTADQASVEYAYSSADDLISSTDELGRTTNFVVDGMGRTIEELDPPPDPNNPNVRPTTQTVYSGMGQVIETVDAMGRATYDFYDDGGNLIKVEAPDPAGGTNYTTTQYVVDPAGNRVREIDPMGRTTAWQFDPANQQIAEQDPSPTDGTNNQTFVRATASGPVTSVELDTAGDPIQELDAAGNETDNIFDSNGDLTSTTGPAPTTGAARPTTTYVYNGDGQVIKDTNALGQSVTLVYNEFGEKVEEIDPSPDGGITPGPVLLWSYDQDGNEVRFTNGMGQTYVYAYNDRNERVEEDDPSPDGGTTPGPVWKWIYNAAGELTEEIDPIQRVTQWVHDGDGNVIQTIAPNLATGGPGDASTTTYDTYDLDGEKTSETTPLPVGASGSTTVTWQYNDLGDVTQETGPAPASGQPAPITSWAYNPDEQVTSETQTGSGTGQPSVTETATFDGLGRETSTTSFAGVNQQFGYDVLSNLVTTTDASGTVTNTFDALGREVKTVDQNGGTTQMGYDLLGNMTSLVDAYGNKTSFQFDGLNRETSDTNQLGASDTFQYNNNGQVTQEVDKDGHTRVFQYDDLGQQTAEGWIAPGGSAGVQVTTKVTGSGYHEDTLETIVLPSPTGGSWTLSLNGKTAGPLPWNANADDVYWAAVSLVGNPNLSNVYSVYGSGTASDPFVIDFNDDLAGTDVGPLTANGSGLTGANGSIQVQDVVPGRLGQYSGGWIEFDTTVPNDTITSGSFTLSVNGNDTSPLPFNATGPQVQAALAALPGVGAGNVFVDFNSGGYGGQNWIAWGIYFVGGLANQQVNWQVVSSTVAGAQGPVTDRGTQSLETTGANDVQQVVINATGGTFALIDGWSDKTTPLAYNASAVQVQAAVQALREFAYSQITVTGSGTQSNPYLITFAGALAGQYVPQFTADSSQLTGTTEWITTAYNADGEIISAGDNFSHYAYTYDGQGDVASVDNAGTPGVPDVVLASQYDAAGNRASLSATIGGTADFLNTYSYDTLSELTVLQQTQQSGGNTVAPKEIDYAYNVFGQVVARGDYTFVGTGPRTDMATGAYGYNSNDLLTSLVYTSDGGQTPIDNLSYTYDPLARVSTFTTIDGTATYGYDPTSQLTSASYAAASGGHEPANLSVTFDPNGNRTATNGTSRTVGADNHITSDGTFNFTYDPEGNLSTRVRISNAPANDYKTVYVWDYRNRLTDVEFFNNSGTLTQHVHYVYDVWDHLIERDLDPNGGGTYTQIVHYVWDQLSPLPPGEGQGEGNIVLAFNGSQQLIARYLNGPNTDAFDQVYTTLAEEDVTSLNSPGTVSFDLPDPQGSVTDIVDSNGNPVDHIVYGPFGAVAYESNTSVSHLTSWQGGLLDSTTGLENFDERWYVLADAVWASEDPERFAAGDTNLTRAMGNSATNFTDPSGLDYIKEIPYDEHTVALYYVDEGFMGRDKPRKFIGIMDPTDPEKKVTRDGMTVFYDDVDDEVNDWGTTTDDWDAWFRKKNVDFNAPNCKNLAVEYGNEYLTPKQQLQNSRGARRQRAEQAEDFAMDGVKNTAMMGAAVSRGFAGGTGTVSRSTSTVGRTGKQARLRALGTDANVGSAERGWIQQEINSINRGQRSNIRVPPGKNLAHRRGCEAKNGYSYEHSDLQDVGLHKLQHKHEGY